MIPVLGTFQVLIKVWQSSGLLWNGPTLSSELGIVSGNDFPDTSGNVKVISAGRRPILEHGMPKELGSSGFGLISGEILAYMSYMDQMKVL